ncbi:MAG: protoporphyrinogen oxidase [bacterium]|nr:protoporphyrinogen oxidase [bacterium]
MSAAAGRKKVLVLGGGVTGLTAAYRLQETARARSLPLDVLLLEGSGRFGGNIGTIREAGCVLEKGPDCFLSVKPEGLALCRDLGLEDQLIGTRAENRRSFVLQNGKLMPVPEGFYLLAPSSFLPFLTTPIFSLAGKLRMGMDLFLPRRKETGDEALASFVRRRFGKEALVRMAQPMIAGIYSADPEELSLAATMPQFLEMERDHRSVILALRHRMRAAAGRKKEAGASGPRYGLFMSLMGGMETLIDALLERVPEGARRLNARAESLRREGARWLVGIEGGGEEAADAVLMALPATAAAKLFAAPAPALVPHLEAIGYGSVVTLNLLFRRAQVAHPLDAMGFVVPAAEGRTLMACSFSSSKFEGRAPEGKVLLRAFTGGAQGEKALSLPDTEVIREVLLELTPLLGLEGEPELAVLERYASAMPQYRVGHIERMKQLEEGLGLLPGLTVAGSAYHGVGVPDCAASAKNAVDRLLHYLER